MALSACSKKIYLHRLVIPAICPVLFSTTTVQHHQGSVGVIGLQAAGLIQTQNSQTVLNQAQRIPVDLIWMEQEIGEA